MDAEQEKLLLKKAMQNLHREVMLLPERKKEILTDWIERVVPSLGLDTTLAFFFYNVAMQRDSMDKPSIVINNSGPVANMNLGQQYGAVTATLTSLSADPEKTKVADSLQAFLKAVEASTEIGDTDKKDLVEAVGTLADTAKEGKRSITAKGLLEWIPTAIKLAPSLLQAWHAYGPDISAYMHALI